MRLGEYDIETIDDGRHEDIQIAHTEKHEKYNAKKSINDIGILYLVRDIIFNGKTIEFLSTFAFVKSAFF